MEIGHHSEVEVSTDRIIGEDHDVSIIMEMTSEETITEMQNYRGQNFRGGYRNNNNRNNSFGRGRSRSRTDNIHVILAEMIEVVVVDLDQVQEPLLTETELDALSVGNMIILLKSVQILKQKRNQNRYNKCII